MTQSGEPTQPVTHGPIPLVRLSHLDALESEAIHIMREVAAELERPVLLFSGGKDSIVLLRLAEKAFRPGRFPFPLMHVDTGHNFPEAIEFRDRRVAELGERLVVASVQESIDKGRVVEQTGPRASRNQLQTTTLLDAMTEHGFDAAIGGARRDEERSRAKERIFSFRDDFGQWDPRAQRPELWNLYNGRIRKGEQVRVFPISNWTELDVWQYVAREQLELPAIYFAHEREVFERDGMLYAASEFVERYPHEEPFAEWVRFRTVGDMSCTGGVRSRAATIEEVVREIAATRITERGETRADDKVSEAAMEDRKRSATSDDVDLAEMLTGEAAASELLRLVTCGSVDDGKSTLIGRLLYDTKQVMSDQLEHVEETSERRGDGYVNLALLTDGLRAEREQGITIDVAYRSFVTPTRRFQLADAPGHVQYTRNMVTGASTADVAVVLLDARKGVIEQTQRHTYIASMLGIPHVVFTVNKMDLVDFDEERFREIERDLADLSDRLGAAATRRRSRSRRSPATTSSSRSDAHAVVDGRHVPRAPRGDRDRSATATSRTAGSRCSGSSGRCPTSTTTTAATRARSRAASGARATRSSCSRPACSTTVASVETHDGPLDVAVQGQSVVVRLADDVDVSRGDMLCGPADQPVAARVRSRRTSAG